MRVVQERQAVQLGRHLLAPLDSGRFEIIFSIEE